MTVWTTLISTKERILCVNVNLTQILVDHFTKHPITQSRGLDDAGTPLQSSEKGAMAITMEVVQGKKEALYWERVPEKIRRQAVQKALGNMPSGNFGDDAEVAEGGPRKRTKRKRNN